LVDVYKDATIDTKTISCSGAPVVRITRQKFLPEIVGFVFNTSNLKNVQPGKTVVLIVQSELKNKSTTYTFTGSDAVSMIRKLDWEPNGISKESDDDLFNNHFK